MRHKGRGLDMASPTCRDSVEGGHASSRESLPPVAHYNQATGEGEQASKALIRLHAASSWDGGLQNALLVRLAERLSVHFSNVT